MGFKVGDRVDLKYKDEDDEDDEVEAHVRIPPMVFGTVVLTSPDSVYIRLSNGETRWIEQRRLVLALYECIGDRSSEGERSAHDLLDLACKTVR